jgi:1-acyl-sn-glycerol-3-phosphate acyltransferase
LQRGREGIAYLASRTDAVIVPSALDGTVGFPALWPSRRWRQPGARVRFGRPFRYKKAFRNARGETLRKMTDEAMYVLASLLPEARRGVYADLEAASQETLTWL